MSSFSYHSKRGYLKQTSKWLCGRKSQSPRLQEIISVSRRTISDLARIADFDTITQTKDLIVSKSDRPRHANILQVIQGKRNTKRLIEVIEREWRLPIDEIRKIYKEDLQRIEAGKHLSDVEVKAFRNQYDASFQGITVAELQEFHTRKLQEAGLING